MAPSQPPAPATPAAADSQISAPASISYWSSIEADVNGMLGGFPSVSRVDLQGSRNFLVKLGVGSGSRIGSAGRRRWLRSEDRDRDGEGEGDRDGDGRIERAVDCGAGIGRITTGLLLSIAHRVDVVEPISKFTSALHSTPGVGQIFNVGLEAWTPGAKYDLFWNQWCLGHLTDEQLVQYLVKCGRALADGGWIVVKENLSSLEEDVFDAVDSSVTRTEQKFRALFAEAGFKVKRTELQKGLPKELYPVRMFALQPGKV